ncbi:MAG TPA: DUF937 domain-containing protein [Atribacter sp.]|jgi:hypothetical protein|uniref:DUF937 domain-containing protein n=1 Tax=Atribacter sp. TaxID=2847780 RepID=UPI002B740EFA|nr:DUF937 domain-containing protein [Atribacterota bacterium]HOT05685.1 DUF937 domain-containing protein [Atribacter sp.]
MDLIDLIKQLNNDDVLGQVSQSMGVEPQQVKKVTQLGLPTLVEAMNRNAKTQEGARSLARALEQHQDDEVDDLSKYIRHADAHDGEKILRHVFSDKSERVESKIAKQTGLDMSQVMGILAQFAPLVLGLLGKEKKEKNIDYNGVANMTSSIANQLGGESGSGLMGMVSQFLDSDQDGDIMDDLGGLFGGLFG